MYAADADPAQWFSCDEASDCAWTAGDGGWPVAVNRSYVEQYGRRVARDAPHTTYFMLGDCFADGHAQQAYLDETRSAVVCEATSCRISVEPSCE